MLTGLAGLIAVACLVPVLIAVVRLVERLIR